MSGTQMQSAKKSPASLGKPAAPAMIQRNCGRALGEPSPDCTPSDLGVAGWQFLFKQNCDELRPGEDANITKLKTGPVKVHGFASMEGPADFNLALSCHRANRIADLIRAKRPDCRVVGTFKHGATPQPQPGAVPDSNPRAFWRDVIVEQTEAASSEAGAHPHCGPDVTDWFVDQVAAAKKNAKVLEVKKQLDIAAYFAPLISSSASLDSQDIVEGAVAVKVNQQRVASGNPPTTRDQSAQNQQLADAQIPVLEYQTALASAGSLDINAITTLQALKRASLLWKDLVGTRHPFDFKNDPSTMGSPSAAHCPETTTCDGTITLCPGEAGSNCFGKDVPGNLFYAAIGEWVGFNENTLQLGSQWAQLASTKHWDPSEDTAMIAFAANLPHSLTRPTFCAAIQSAKASFGKKDCSDCPGKFAPPIINP